MTSSFNPSTINPLLQNYGYNGTTKTTQGMVSDIDALSDETVSGTFTRNDLTLAIQTLNKNLATGNDPNGAKDTQELGLFATLGKQLDQMNYTGPLMADSTGTSLVPASGTPIPSASGSSNPPPVIPSGSTTVSGSNGVFDSSAFTNLLQNYGYNGTTKTTQSLVNDVDSLADNGVSGSFDRNDLNVAEQTLSQMISTGSDQNIVEDTKELGLFAALGKAMDSMNYTGSLQADSTGTGLIPSSGPVSSNPVSGLGNGASGPPPHCWTTHSTGQSGSPYGGYGQATLTLTGAAPFQFSQYSYTGGGYMPGWGDGGYRHSHSSHHIFGRSGGDGAARQTLYSLRALNAPPALIELYKKIYSSLGLY